MVTEYQAHNGAVNTSTTPSVQYAYSFVTSSGGPNHSRLVSMTYPNGRVLNYNYNSGVDDRISLLSSISDSTGTLEAYSYLGLNTVVTRSHPQTGINLNRLTSFTQGDTAEVQNVQQPVGIKGEDGLFEPQSAVFRFGPVVAGELAFHGPTS